MGQESLLKSLSREEGDFLAVKEQFLLEKTLASDPDLSKLVSNAILPHLRPVQGFLSHHRFSIGSFLSHESIVESLAYDLDTRDITNALLPNYQRIKWLMGVRNIDCGKEKKTGLLSDCLQLLIISHFTFRADDSDTVQTLTEKWISHFIRNEVLLSFDKKSQLLKLLAEYTNHATERPLLLLSKICSYHWRVIWMVVNLKIHRQQFDVAALIIKDLMRLIEISLIRFIEHSKGVGTFFKRPCAAHEKIYQERLSKLNYKRIVSNSKSMQTLDETQATQRQKMIIECLLTVLGHIEWTKRFQIFVCENQDLHLYFDKYRVYLLSGSLMSKDTEIIAKVRKVRWPTFALTCSK
ncbi:LAMI_0G12706g1_1 [Lachancea mirantina]|uniref:LAMI_0G12706g1_1 n=1 Tax=Lachancea mirantina TaxID=1230905 RepID=A0A1G4KBH8_9SACH|nr:LAMI_0G12706g1_1 [Lachancea mirantina]